MWPGGPAGSPVSRPPWLCRLPGWAVSAQAGYSCVFSGRPELVSWSRHCPGWVCGVRGGESGAGREGFPDTAAPLASAAISAAIPTAQAAGQRAGGLTCQEAAATPAQIGDPATSGVEPGLTFVGPRGRQARRSVGLCEDQVPIVQWECSDPQDSQCHRGQRGRPGQRTASARPPSPVLPAEGGPSRGWARRGQAAGFPRERCTQPPRRPLGPTGKPGLTLEAPLALVEMVSNAVALG